MIARQYSRRLVLPLLAAMAWCGSAVQARDVFVNNQTGDDRRDGSSAVVIDGAGGPCRSIRRALQLAQHGDRIILAGTDEPYRESITLQAGRHSGVENRPFEIVGNGAVLDGSQPVPKSAWRHVGDEIYRRYVLGDWYQSDPVLVVNSTGAHATSSTRLNVVPDLDSFSPATVG